MVNFLFLLTLRPGPKRGPGPRQFFGVLAESLQRICNYHVKHYCPIYYFRVELQYLVCLILLAGCSTQQQLGRAAEHSVRQSRKAVYLPYVPPTEAIDWVNSIEAGRRLARQREVPLMVYVSTKWCGPCKILKSVTYKDPKVILTVNTRVVAVTLDGDTPEGRAYCRKKRITSYPTLVFEDWRGREIDRAFGYRSPTHFLSMFEDMLADKNTVTDFERRLRVTPNNAQLMLQYAQHLALRGELVPAESMLRKVMELDPTGSKQVGDRALYVLARYVLELKRRDRRGALLHYNQLLTQFPQSTLRDSTTLRVAQIYASFGQKERAFDALARVANRTPLHAGRLLRSCSIAQRLGLQPQRLLNWAKAACELRSDGQPWFVLAGIYRQLGQFSRQLMALREAAQRSPKNLSYLRAYERVRKLMKQKNYQP